MDCVKLAIASDGKAVSRHFGHCEGFALYTFEDGRIVKREHVLNPGHRPGFLPNFLCDLGVEAVVSGGMGAGALEIFANKGIEVFTGAEGDCERIATDFVRGELLSAGSVCSEHRHADSCGGHSE
jgi:predicted Fe-Mo cluster-binding NifX family protein